MEVAGRAEWLRRCVHIAVGIPAWIVTRETAMTWAYACFAGAFFNTLLLSRVPVVGDVTRVVRGTRGTILYPLVIGVLLVLFRERPQLACVGWLALALGDGSTPFFARVRSCAWPTNPKKKLIPSLLGGLVAGAGASFVIDAKIAFPACLVAALADAIPWCDDNVSWPVLAATVAWGMST